MAILNLQPLTPKTPEEKLLESIQGLDIQRPTPDVPRFRGYGDFLAQRGGFAPEDLRTREELMGMTQAEVDEYQRKRRQARRAGISETLLRVGQAFQGKDATALAMQREQARQQAELQRGYQEQYQSAIQAAEQVDPGKAALLRSLGLPGWLDLQQKQAEQMFLGGGSDLTEREKTQKKYNDLMDKPVEGRSAEDNRNIAIYEKYLFGQPRVISFFDSEGNVVPEESITSTDLALNPNILKEKASLGLSTVGQSPSITPKGAKSIMTLARDDYLGVKSQLDTINDLASIIEENKDAFTFAGSLSNFVNSAKYQIQSAERLSNLTKLQQNEKEFTELDNMLDSKYGDILDKISQDRAVAKSIFLRLAYGTAKEIDPSGRLSDNDVKIAMDIIGSLGPNWKANLSTLENLANTTRRQYFDRYETRIRRVGDEDLVEANKYQTIPQFLGGKDWRASTPTVTSPATSSKLQEALAKYPPRTGG
jgi:hypothetical protein